MIRTRRTQAEIAALKDAVVAAMTADHPQIVRNVYYVLEAEGIIPKTDAAYRSLSEHMVKMRKAGELPYGWVVDETRLAHHVPAYRDVADFIESTSAYYRADMWRDIPDHVELWVESRSLAGVVLRETQRLGVTLRPLGGMPSASMIYTAAEDIASQGKQCAIVYIMTDHDTAGFVIANSTERSLRQHLDDFGIELKFSRVALTLAQIRGHGIKTYPPKPGEKRSPRVDENAELEAMPAHVLRSGVRTLLTRHLPAGAVEMHDKLDSEAKGQLLRISQELRVA